MFQHNLKLILRTFTRFKTAFFINLTGLSLGLAGTLLIYLWVNDELRVDKFNTADSRLFQVMMNDKQGEKMITSEGTGALLGETFKKDLPEVQYAVTTAPSSWFQQFDISLGNNTIGAKGNFVGKDYFNVFSYKLIRGNKDKVLEEKNAIVLSEKMARRLFHTTDNVVGKIVEWKWQTFSKPCIVTGIYKDPPLNATDQFEFVLTMASWNDIVPGPILANGPFLTYIVLKEGTDANRFNNKIADFIKKRVPAVTATLFVRKYSDAYLYSKYENGVQAGGRIGYVRLFSIIAVFILVIACINFMNLSTARASRRMKEVGVRKVLGARRSTLIYQYMGESVLMSFISLLIALVLVIIALPHFNNLTGKYISLNADPLLILSILAITLFTGIVAGSYPALYLSGFSPAHILKGKFKGAVGELLARKGLVIFQFTLSVIFIVCVMVVHNQINYVQKKNLGYDKDNVIYFELKGKVAEHVDGFLAALKNVSGVINASSIEQKIILPSFTPAPGVQWEGKNKNGEIRFYQLPVNYDLIETLDIKMAQGRAFSRDFKSDSMAVVLNEAAVRVMGMTDPIGKTVNVFGQDRHIVGVTRNFHFNSLHEEIRPFIFRLAPKETMCVMVKVAKVQDIQRIGKLWADFNPGFSFDYRFLDNDYQVQYASEKLVGTLSRYFALFAILISCLGLFGLAAFTVERRMKEIGIRKILGATEFSIVYLLSADFTKIILMAVMIALPLSYFIVSWWLNDFAYRISLNPVFFIAAGMIAIFMAWFTISLQTIKASLINPVISLKDE